VRALVNGGADVNAQLKDGSTSLHMAVSSQQFPTCTLLLNLGADKETRDAAGYTALLRAAEIDTPDVTRALVAANADVHATLGDKTSALHLASRAGHAAVVAALLPYLEVGGAADSGVSSTPLHMASERGHADVVLLLMRSSDVDADARDAQGRTARDLAMVHEHTNVPPARVELARSCPRAGCLLIRA
jgi:ankyrin repeat protein